MENVIPIQGWSALDRHSKLKTASVVEKQELQKGTFPLRMAGEGERVEIVALKGGSSFRDRLAGLGLNIGARVEVIQNSMNGKILIGRDGSRLFLGGGMAHKIQVKIV